MRALHLAPLCALVLFMPSVAATLPAEGPSVRNMVEFTQIVQPRNQDDDLLREQVSPDGAQAFVVTRRADVSTDRNRYEIQWLDLAPDHLTAQRSPSPVTIFSAAVDHDDDFGSPAIRDVQWRGDKTLVFLAKLDGRAYQVYRLEVSSRELVQLTHETAPIVSYDLSRDLRRIVYAVQVPNPPLKKGVHAVTVGSQSFWAVKFGQDDLRAQDWFYRYFVADAASFRPPRPLGTAFMARGGTKPTVSVSPDGRWALLPRWDPERQAVWASRYRAVGELSKEYGRSQQLDPLRYFSNPVSYVPRRLTAWRLEDGKEQAIVDAPDDVHRGGFARPDSLWQGDGGSVILAGTYLPAAENGRAPQASHIIEYWPDQGRWADVAALQKSLDASHALPDGFLVVDGGRRREFHRQAVGGWMESTEEGEGLQGHPSWTLHVAQALNQPPDVYASGPSGDSRRLTRLNPQFDARTWGSMQPYTWHDAAGREWAGGLLSGKDMDAHTRYPLLIQTYGFSPNRFYLDGPNDRDGHSSAFAGRAFLREGILVLAMPWNSRNATAQSEQAELQAFNEGVRGAVDTLVRQGRVDPARVGIIGWSSTGKRVLNLATFGHVPLRAATMADGDANTLFSLTVTYGRSDILWDLMEQANGGLPAGEGLAAWVRNDPALHTDCVHAAMRIESYGPWVLPNWDIYALLRRQYKPVDMIVLPNGTHSLLTPGDRMASLQGNVDWFAFWLSGRTRTVPMLVEETAESVAMQYDRWREMEILKAKDDARAGCGRPRDGRTDGVPMPS